MRPNRDSCATHGSCLLRRQILQQQHVAAPGASTHATRRSLSTLSHNNNANRPSSPLPACPRLQLLNGTIQSIALAVNKVLTATYHAVYSDAQEGDELTLLTAPLASTAEVQSLYESGIIDIASALPAALHSLGATALEVAGAVQRRKQADESGTDTKMLEAQNQAKLGDADVALKSAQTLKTTAETEVVKQQVGKVKADTKKTLHDASAPHATPGAAAAGGGSSSSGAGKASAAKK